MRLNPGWRGQEFFRQRMVLFSFAAAFVFLLLLLRLWYLQIISYDRFQERSQQNRMRILPVAAPRGPIYDRQGELLVDNRPSFDIAVMRQEVKEVGPLFERLGQLLNVEPQQLEDNWQKRRHLPNYQPVVLARDVGRDALERVMEHSVELPGVIPEVRPVRSYVHQQLASHLIGYLGEMTQQEFAKSEFANYRVGDFVGKNGLEQQLEHLLKGQEGERLIEVNVRGNLLRQLESRAATPGKKVYLTLSRALQETAEKALEGKAGAAVALEVDSGRILAMTSQPGYDPSLFAAGISPDAWKQLLDDPLLPLQNKAIAGQYPPASTFKIPVALAALQHDVALPETEVFCNNRFFLGESTFRCWKRWGHGKTDLDKAMRESCDVWFYQVGLEVGIDRISETSRLLGLGRRTGLAIPGEKRGLIPDRQWKKKRFGAGWYGGETVITAIGQGAVLTTPLQLAVMTSVIANGGTLYQPQVVERVEDWQGLQLQDFEPVVLQKTRFKQSALDGVKQGLESVVNEQRGTGRLARLPGIRVAGKTGTAQVVRRLSDEEEEAMKGQEIPYRYRDHALFVAYAPADAPKIAVAVVVEHGEHGSTAAAPVAGAILRQYFGLPPASDEIKLRDGEDGD